MKPILFVDRDGTLVEEPEDFQVDSLEKIKFKPHVFTSLKSFVDEGYDLVMITNQDGLGTHSFPKDQFQKCQDFIISAFESQGITFQDILICPHFEKDQCSCRKPQLGLVLPYLTRTDWEREKSAVIGDRDSDFELGKKMNLKSFQLNDKMDWPELTHQLLKAPRQSFIQRQTTETQVSLKLDIDGQGKSKIFTGLGFFDHMLDQISKQSCFNLEINAQGDLEVDDHHLVEDVALCFGKAFQEALAHKVGIERYASTVVMDDSSTQIALDCSGRPFLVFKGDFHRESLNNLSMEMVKHFFHSFCQSAGLTLHIQTQGENTHHQVESLFKAFGRVLKKASRKTRSNLASTKGVL